jgi:hypothetical protein
MEGFNTKLPDEFVQMRDDAEAKAFICALGILSDFEQDVCLTQPDSGHDDNTMFVGYYGHPTHWILAARTLGNDDEKENGFVVTAWPKNKYPESIIETVIASFDLGKDVRRKIENEGDQNPN